MTRFAPGTIKNASGYPLDSADPNSLRCWWAYFDHGRISGRRSVYSLLYESKKQFAAALRRSAVEAECKLVQVVGKLPRRDGTLVGSEQPPFQQRGDSVLDSTRIILHAVNLQVVAC